MAFLTPLRYPGGKGDLANFMKLVYLENNLLDAPYVEVYAGGAAIALNFLIGEYTTHIHINDLDRSIFAFWHSVLNETDELCQRIEETSVTIEEWHNQQRIQNQSEQVSTLDLGFSTFFLIGPIIRELLEEVLLVEKIRMESIKSMLGLIAAI